MGRPYFTQKGFEILMHAHIFPRLDYCNSLYTGITDNNLRILQLIQNYAARLVLNKRKFYHATPLLRELHWLPVKQRIDYKVLLFCFKAKNSLSPEYLSMLLKPYIRPSNLRCLSPYSFQVPSSKLSSMGDRTFSIYAPKIWNTLPSDIQTCHSLPVFKKLLKTYLFGKAFSDST